jgi:2-haloacid dehalogenase
VREPVAAAADADSIDAAVFDLGGVLIDWSPYHLYRQYLTDDAEIAAFLEEIDLYVWLRGVDADKAFEKSVYELAERHPHRAELIRAYWERWPETMRGPLPDTVELLRRLKAKAFPVYALTNWSRETWHHAGRFDFLSWFDDIVVSGHEGVAKPDPAIFHLACERFGVEPATTVFIDDHAPNVESAANLGFTAIQFTDAGQLERQLSDLGLPL